MRTTISLSEGLAEDVRRRAAQQGISASALIERLIRAGLHAEAPSAPAPPFRLVTAGGSGVLPGVDLDRNARLVDDDDSSAGTLDKVGR
ncbi:MAG: ribbon-helix-helix protein, CopG family [Deltaproteobacteria bacterium]|nr:ribbon-helix-helix protein, CopG family [Nannocystaceae bacterium]